MTRTLPAICQRLRDGLLISLSLSLSLSLPFSLSAVTYSARTHADAKRSGGMTRLPLRSPCARGSQVQIVAVRSKTGARSPALRRPREGDSCANAEAPARAGRAQGDDNAWYSEIKIFFPLGRLIADRVKARKDVNPSHSARLTSAMWTER